MASALTILFLGCWLAGQSGVQGEGTDRNEDKQNSQQGAGAYCDCKGGTNSTQLGTTSALSPSLKDAGSTPARGTSLPPQETTAAHTQPGGSESDLSGAIIAGVIVGAAGLLLLLLLLLLCRRCTRAREGSASRQSRELEAATATTVYALVGQGKQQDVPPQEPDTGAEGLTYTELDRQVLQAKQEAPAPAPEPVLYATVSRSQGAPPPPPSPEPGRVTETTGQGARPPESDTATPPGEQAQLTVSA